MKCATYDESNIILENSTEEDWAALLDEGYKVVHHRHCIVVNLDDMSTGEVWVLAAFLAQVLKFELN